MQQGDCQDKSHEFHFELLYLIKVTEDEWILHATLQASGKKDKDSSISSA